MKTGKKVAIIGSGHSELAAAQQLIRFGHDVVVFERSDRKGNQEFYLPVFLVSLF